MSARLLCRQASPGMCRQVALSDNASVLTSSVCLGAVRVPADDLSSISLAAATPSLPLPLLALIGPFLISNTLSTRDACLAYLRQTFDRDTAEG